MTYEKEKKKKRRGEFGESAFEVKNHNFQRQQNFKHKVPQKLEKDEPMDVNSSQRYRRNTQYQSNNILPLLGLVEDTRNSKR